MFFDNVSLIVWATFFAPVPSPVIGILLFGAGLWLHVAYSLVTFGKGAVNGWFPPVRSTLRMCALLVLLSSWVWSDVTIPKMVEMDSVLHDMVESFPENITVVIQPQHSIMRAFNVVDGKPKELTSDVAISLGRPYLDFFRLEMRQTPVVDWIVRLRTMAGFFEVIHKAVLIWPWLNPLKDSRKVDALLDVTEYRVGDAVLSGGRRYGENRQSGIVSRVFPSMVLEKFKYEIEWTANTSLPTRTVERASDLVPAVAKIYFFSGLDGRTDALELPRDALAVLTRTNMTILEGYSHYYNRYWRYQRNRSRSAPIAKPVSGFKGELSLREAAEQFRDNFDVQEGICDVPREAPIWTEISLSQAARWKPLITLGYFGCSFDLEHIAIDASISVNETTNSTALSEGAWLCSKKIASENADRVRRAAWPFFPLKHGADAKNETGFHSPSYLVRYYIWWIFFFVYQTFLLLMMSLSFVALFVAPISYVIVNSLRHVEDSASDGKTVLHVSLRTFDSLALSYQVACALKEFNHQWAHDLFISNIRTVAFAHLLFICFMLFKLRANADSTIELERIRMLNSRKPQVAFAGAKSRPRQERPDEEIPFCRICFEQGGDLVSPCLCDGTMKFVHPQCLTEWRYRSVQVGSFVRCDQCGFRYMIRKTWWSIIFRSSLFVSFITLVGVVILHIAVAYVFKILDVVIIGSRLNEHVLGPKVSSYIREGRWINGAFPANPSEQWFVEAATDVLGRFYLEIGHMVCSYIVWGFLSFFLFENFAFPWVWVVGDEAIDDEGWLLYLGGRTALVSCVGHYGLFAYIWKKIQAKTATFFVNKQTSVLSVKHPKVLEIGPGTLLKTPYGLVRVIRYRPDDDVVETASERFQGRVYTKYLLYRSGAESLKNDKIVD